ncbi:hypothetical protein BDV97DRAFT_27127 [Delphinella strobiligena]|nr:hypothetical protein BDV97DRAFT_27127 [Delphinella strobiligena]
MADPSTAPAAPVIVPPKESGPLAMIGIASILLSLAVFFVAARMYVRTRMTKNTWGWDDWAILVTLAFYIAECGILFNIAHLERSGLSFSNAKKIALLVPTEQSLYVAGTISLKASFCIFYHKVLSNNHWQKRLLLISTLIYAAFALAIIGLITFDCGIPSSQQLMESLTGKCIPFKVFERLAISHGVLNCVTDWVFTILPISIIWQTSLPLGKKVSVAVVILLAGLGSLASCVRTYYVSGLNPTPRFYVSSTDTIIWAIVEPGLGITAACLATLRPLYARLFEKGRGVLGSKGGKSPAPFGHSGKGGLIHVTQSVKKDNETGGSDDYKNYGYDDEEMGLRRSGRVTTIITGNALRDSTELVDLNMLLRQ